MFIQRCGFPRIILRLPKLILRRMESAQQPDKMVNSDPIGCRARRNGAGSHAKTPRRQGSKTEETRAKAVARLRSWFLRITRRSFENGQGSAGDAQQN